MSNDHTSTDHGTIIEPGEAAIVTTGGMTEMTLLMPIMDETEAVPPLVLFLTAVMVRGEQDPDFFREQIEWMKSLRT